MRIAFIEVGHWHASTYAGQLLELGESIYAVSDQNLDIARQRGEQWNCKAYQSYQEMLTSEKPDFVFAFGIHSEMAKIASYLVESGVPFVMEKPMGVDWRELHAVDEKAKQKGLFAGVDLVMRCTPLTQRLLQLKEEGEFGTLLSYHHHLLAGAPQRYVGWGVPWMLDPRQAGGGPIHNFGPHVVDLFLLFADSPVRSVCCVSSNALHGLPIEHYATLSVATENGAIGTMTVGYATPEGLYARHFALSTDHLFVWSERPDTGVIHFRDGRTEDVGDEVHFTKTYIQETLRRLGAGELPLIPIGEMAKALQVINAAQESARTGEVVLVESSQRVEA